LPERGPVQGKVFPQNYVNAVGIWLQRVSTEVVKKNAPDVASAANTCIAQFRRSTTRGSAQPRFSDRSADFGPRY